MNQIFRTVRRGKLDLLERYKRNPSKDLRNTIVCGYKEVIEKVAKDSYKKYIKYIKSYELVDVIQEAYLSALKAIDFYDIETDGTFEIYLKVFLKRNLSRFIMEDNLIYVPIRKVTQYYQWVSDGRNSDGIEVYSGKGKLEDISEKLQMAIEIPLNYDKLDFYYQDKFVNMIVVSVVFQELTNIVKAGIKDINYKVVSLYSMGYTFKDIGNMCGMTSSYTVTVYNRMVRRYRDKAQIYGYYDDLLDSLLKE